MLLNLLGLSTAVAAFLGIWLGHVSVRKVEAATPDLRLPVILASGLGLGLCAASLVVAGRAPSAVLGVLGITVLWDAYELVRQEKRVRRGHAPANPLNPRHAAFLAAGEATTVDLLKREPALAHSANSGMMEDDKP